MYVVLDAKMYSLAQNNAGALKDIFLLLDI